MRDTAVVWFRNDLRLHDNEALTKAVSMAEYVVPVFVFDERLFFTKTKYGFKKTEYHRAKFIIECVQDLKLNLEKIGSNLIIRIGKPEDEISNIVENLKASWVFCNRERTSEEVNVQDTLEKNLWHLGAEIFYTRGKMLYYTSDLPFPILQAPDHFSTFRKEVEKIVSIRKPLPEPSEMKSLHPNIEDFGIVPDITSLGYKNANVKHGFEGGETNGINQLNHFVWNKDDGGLKSFKNTRNNPLGWDTSSKLSPWLSTGCISPKMIYHEVKKFETQMEKTESTYWMIFELLWRDYFRLIGKKYGNRIFKLDGVIQKSKTWKHDHVIFKKWCEGKTGIPFIDASMRQLAKTGFVSNKGRLNTASFLTKDLGINWLWGAEYFESLLLGYDPCSNYGNWNYIAGVGFDPMKDRNINVINQAKKFDPEGLYVKTWIPELANISSDLIHTPWKDPGFKETKYPSPIIDVHKLDLD